MYYEYDVYSEQLLGACTLSDIFVVFKCFHTKNDAKNCNPEFLMLKKQVDIQMLVNSLRVEWCPIFRLYLKLYSYFVHVQLRKGGQ